MHLVSTFCVVLQIGLLFVVSLTVGEWRCECSSSYSTDSHRRRRRRIDAPGLSGSRVCCTTSSRNREVFHTYMHTAWHTHTHTHTHTHHIWVHWLARAELKTSWSSWTGLRIYLSVPVLQAQQTPPSRVGLGPLHPRYSSTVVSQAVVCTLPSGLTVIA